MNEKNKVLFGEFGPVTKQEWIDKATIDLKGAEFSRLVWKNLSNITVDPFYNAEDKQVLLNNTGENSGTLMNYRKINVVSETTGNALALKAIEEGITGLLFDIKENVSVAQLLKGIDLNNLTVSFILSSNTIDFAKEFFAFVEKNKVNAENLTGYFDIEIIQNYVTTGNLATHEFDKLVDLITLSAKYPNFKTVSISGAVYLDSGANQVQEVAYTLNSLVFLIENLGKKDIDAATIFNNLHVELAIGSEYFIEIGKFRAFQNLLQEIAKKYGVVEFSPNLTAKTSIWNKTVTDANTNMLRATTEAMSAILGNVDGLLIDPYDKEYGKPTDFSSRIAGNIAIILKEESYFGKVSNPVDGSYYIEEVTSKIATKALELFKSIESSGGFYTSFEEEIIQHQIADIRFEKIKLISQRRLALVGVNKYPNLMEKVLPSMLSDGKTGANSDSKILKPRRASLEIEALRKFTENLVESTGVRPAVALVSYGNLTMRKARAAFAYDFMGVSGFNILPEKSFADAEQAAKESAKSDSNVVIICSSDQDYDATALDFVKTFRAINTNKVLLLAGNPANFDALKKEGLDGVIHMKSDILQTISNVQDKVEKTIKTLEV